MRQDFFYISKKGNIFNLTLSPHAIKQFIKRFENINNKVLSEEDAIKHIRKLFDFAETEKQTEKLKERQRKYEQTKGQNTVYLVNSGWRFVLELNNKVISTIEVYGKLKQCNNGIRMNDPKDDPDTIFRNGLKELRKEYKEKLCQTSNVS